MKPIERLDIFIKYCKLSISGFEKKVGLSNNSLQTAIKRRSNLKDETLNTILNNFPQLNAQWLLTGDGKMLNGDLKEETTLSIEAQLEKANLEIKLKDQILEERERTIQLLLKLYGEPKSEAYNKEEKKRLVNEPEFKTQPQTS